MKQDTHHQSDLAQRYSEINEHINAACKQYQQKRENVHLLAVSKGHPSLAIKRLYSLGQRHFGESYLSESQDKQQELTALDITWHFIGRIQSNKTAQIANNFTWVHSVDRLKIAKRLNEQRSTDKAELNIFLQINIDDEASKAGTNQEELHALANEIIKLPKLRLRGLMALPQRHHDMAQQRQTFSRVRMLQAQLRDQLHSEHGNALSAPFLDCLSMGMSNDFEAAMAEGATHLRIGSALFGPRNT